MFIAATVRLILFNRRGVDRFVTRQPPMSDPSGALRLKRARKCHRRDCDRASMVTRRGPTRGSGVIQSRNAACQCWSNGRAMNDKSCPTIPLYLQRAFDAMGLWKCSERVTSHWYCLQRRVRRMHCAADHSSDNNFRRPIDVNDPADKHKIYLVEKFHFTPEVAALIRGSTSKLPGDIHYTLRHIPNHYGALDAMARYQLKNPASRPIISRPTATLSGRWRSGPRMAGYTCSTGRISIAPRDTTRPSRCMGARKNSVSTLPELYYNRGLLEFQRDNLDQAATYAAKAYAGGYPLPGAARQARQGRGPDPGFLGARPVRLCIDLAALRGAGRHGAVGAIEPPPCGAKTVGLLRSAPRTPPRRDTDWPRRRDAHRAALARSLATRAGRLARPRRSRGRRRHNRSRPWGDSRGRSTAWACTRSTGRETGRCSGSRVVPSDVLPVGAEPAGHRSRRALRVRVLSSRSESAVRLSPRRKTATRPFPAGKRRRSHGTALSARGLRRAMDGATECYRRVAGRDARRRRRPLDGRRICDRRVPERRPRQLDGRRADGAEAGSGRARSFSIGFDADGYDEMEYARSRGAAFRARGARTLSDARRGARGDAGAAARDRRAVRELLGRRRLSLRNAGTRGGRLCLLAVMAATSSSRQSRYAKQLLFERYQRVPPCCVVAYSNPCSVRSGAHRRVRLRQDGALIEQARVPLPDRLQSYNYLHRHAPSEVFAPGFSSRWTARSLAALARGIRGAGARRRDQPHAVPRLGVHAARQRPRQGQHRVSCGGNTVAYPMLDHALVDLACRLPGHLKMQYGELRSFYKRATRGPASARDHPQDQARVRYCPSACGHGRIPGLRRMSETALDSLARARHFQDAASSRKRCGCTARVMPPTTASWSGC